MPKQTQAIQMRYSDEELNLIKNTFAENDGLLKILRKIFLQLPLKEDKEKIKEVFKNDALMKLMRKSFLPEIDGDAPLNQIIDLWMTIQIIDKDPLMAVPHLKARNLVIHYLDQQLSFLSGEGEQRIIFEALSQLADNDADICAYGYVNLIARNTIIQHVEQQLMQLKLLAGLKDETIEETMKRLASDSAK